MKPCDFETNFCFYRPSDARDLLSYRVPFGCPMLMSALPPKADIRPRDQDVCFGPLADSCSATKQRLYWITSSARASSVGGTVRPSVLAVLRLITSSYLVGVCTGRSAAFSPLRIRST